MMELLLNKEKASEILQIAIGIEDNVFDAYAREAQDFDLKPLLCPKFYFELIQNRSDNDLWQKLFDGATYQVDGIDYFFRGFLDVLSYFTYARLLRKSNNVSTSHGFVTKLSPHSEPLSVDEKNNMYHAYKKDAHKIFNELKNYIEENISDYQSWNDCQDDCSPSKKSGFKTTVIK